MLENIPFVPSILWGIQHQLRLPFKCHRDSCPFYWKKQLEALYPPGCFAQNLASEASKSEPHGEGCWAGTRVSSETHTRLSCLLFVHSQKDSTKTEALNLTPLFWGETRKISVWDQGPPAVRSVASVVRDSNFFGMMDLCFCKDVGAAEVFFRKCQGTNLLWRVPRTSPHAGHLHLGDSQWKQIFKSCCAKY